MRPFLIFVALLLGTVHVVAQSADTTHWPITEQCAVTNNTPIESFSGRIFAYEPEVGIRAVRADLTTSYFVAFEGANFTGAAAISPSGDFVAIPSGLISFSTLVDETYQINEIRIQSTDPSTTTIANRISWNANYRGTQQDLVMRDLRWLDETSLLYAADSWQNNIGDTVISTINVMTDETEAWDNPLIKQLANGLSPDNTRGFGLYDFQIGLYDIESGALLRDYTAQRATLAGWSPTSDHLIIQTSERIDGEYIPYLELVERDGEAVDRIANLSAAQLRWSPDGTQFAFSTYDDDLRAHQLFIGDMETKTLTDMCVSVRYGNITTGYGLMWSPDSTILAVLLPDTAQPLHLLDLASTSLHPVAIYTETRYGFLIAWTD